jgi:hypothetical protein
MTIRIHDYIRLVAVILNIAAMVTSVLEWVSLSRAPLSAWNVYATYLLAISLAPPFALVAIMVKPREPWRGCAAARVIVDAVTAYLGDGESLSESHRRLAHALLRRAE